MEINKTLNYIDKKVLELNPDRIENIDKNFGLGGVVLYILARLRTIEMEKTESPFDDKYLHSLYLRLKEIISQIDIYSDSIDIFLSFIQYYEKENGIKRTNIYDVSHLSNPKELD